MNPEVKQQWVAALRSGKYPQGKLKLTIDGTYCCWGVLCDIYRKTVVMDKSITISELSVSGLNSMPDIRIHNWAGTIIYPLDNPANDLAKMNDGASKQENGEPHTFLTIADFIEKNL